MIGILYFSSTGNSLYISEMIKERLGGKILYIPNYSGDGSEFDKLIIVSPIYSFGLPAHVYDLFPRINKSTPITVVLNYGGMIGGADYFVYRYACEIGLKFSGVYTLKMPENFTLAFTVPKFYMNRTLKSADKRIAKVIESIQNSENKIPKNKSPKQNTYFKNKANWHIIGERFSVTEDCINCGKCVAICPSKNISMTEKGVVFSDKCVACLGCYHRCSKKAIVYRNKRKQFRYINPNINESLIGVSDKF